MKSGLKMVAAAVVAAALTAALFMTFWTGTTDREPPVPVADAPAPASPAPSADEGEPSWLHDLPPLRGDGVITGRVATEEGEGVSGIVVIATPWPQSNRSSDGWLPPVQDAEESARRAAAATHRRIAGTRRATTDAKGEYSIPGLAEVGYGVQAYGEFHELRPVRGHQTREVRPGGRVDFTASPVITVRFLIDGIDPTSGDRITAVYSRKRKDLERGGGFSWDPEHMTRQIAPGTWWMQAVQGRNRERISEEQEVTLVAGSPEVSVGFLLLDQPGIRGTVTMADDLESQSIEVSAMPYSGTELPTAKELSRLRSGKRGRVDERTGRYAIVGLSPGRYLVRATVRNSSVSGSAIVTVEDRMAEQDLVIAIEDETRFTRVRVLGPDGEPLKVYSASFSISFEGPRGLGGLGAETIQLKDGSWFVGPDSRMPLDTLESGATFSMNVRHRDLGRREVVYDPESEQELEIRFSNPATLNLRITGLKAAGAEGIAKISLRHHLPENGITMGSGQSGVAGGLFTLDQVQPGEWMIVLECGAVMVDRKMVTLREGDNKLDWALPALHSLRLITGNPDQDTRFSLKRLDPGGDWTHQFSSTGETGEAEYRFLPPGRYELSGSYGGEQRRIPVNIPADTEVRLQ